jgi:isocitrate dehydrogenase
VFRELAADYPEITTEHQIVDIGTARLAVKPERYDVVLAPNLYGDILSDVAAEVAGSVGLAPSANVGDGIAMFEAIHGSAPDIAGQGVANPSGLLLSAVMMLVHLGQGRVATRIHNAWLKTLDDGIHSADIASSATVQRVGTDAFARAVIDRLGEVPRRLKTVAYHDGIATPTDAARLDNPAKARPRAVKTLDGVDVFLQWTDAGRDPNALGRALEPLASPEFALKMISNRGVKVYPGGSGAAYLADHWRCRFRLVDPAAGFKQMLALYARIDVAGLEIIKTEQLFRFDGEPGYALAQGE